MSDGAVKITPKTITQLRLGIFSAIILGGGKLFTPWTQDWDVDADEISGDDIDHDCDGNDLECKSNQNGSWESFWDFLRDYFFIKYRIVNNVGLNVFKQ